MVIGRECDLRSARETVSGKRAATVKMRESNETTCLLTTATTGTATQMRR
ncbi:MAG: hypothetical protein NVSMB60_26480 [Mycobacterium sp.]